MDGRCFGHLRRGLRLHDLAQAWQTAEIGEQAVAQMVSMPADARAKRYESLGMTSGIAQKVAAGADSVASTDGVK